MRPAAHRLAGVALAGLLAGMAAQAPAQAEVPIAVGMVEWPADAADAARGRALEDCLVTRLQVAAPELRITRQQVIRDALFPLLEPAAQPADEPAFAALLGRADVQARLAHAGPRFLIAFSGATRVAQARGSVLCSAGCIGFSWQGESTAIDAAIWSLADGHAVGREGARIEGNALTPALLFVVPIAANTQAQACRELGARLAEALRQLAAAPAGPAR